jgi:hypothetical protein
MRPLQVKVIKKSHNQVLLATLYWSKAHYRPNSTWREVKRLQSQALFWAFWG